MAAIKLAKTQKRTREAIVKIPLSSLRCILRLSVMLPVHLH